MPDLTLTRGDQLPSNRQGGKVLVPPGEYPASLLRNVPGVQFISQVPRGAILVGGVKVPGEDDPSNLRVLDGSPGVSFEGFIFRGSKGHGVRMTGCPNARITNCLSEQHAIEGYIFGACDDLLVEASEAGHCGQDVNDRAHALYVSYGSQKPTVRDFYGHDCTGSCAQFNGKIGPMKGVTVQRLRAERCGSQGTLALSLMGVSGLFEDLYFEDNNRQSEYLGVLFADGASGPCRNVTLRSFSPTAGRFRLENGSTATIDAGAGWSPGTPTLPPPIEPSAGMTDKEQTAAIRDLQRRVGALERAA